MIQPPQKETKIASKEPQNRQKLSYARGLKKSQTEKWQKFFKPSARDLNNYTIFKLNRIKLNTPNCGFGDYQIPNNQKFIFFDTIEKIKKIALTCFAILALAASIYLATLFPAAIPLPIAFAALTGKCILDLIGIYNRAPPITHLFDPQQTETIAPLAQFHKDGNYSAIAFKDSVDSFKWKCKLIEQAQHSIILSGCYAGGKSFDIILDLIATRMQEKDSHLKVTIISSNVFHTQKNLEKIKNLEKLYPTRFLNISHSEYTPYYISNTKYTLTNNHTKALIIDGGAYFILGGSGVVSFFTDHSGLEEPIPKESPYGLFTNLCPAAFRDTDFAFHSPKPDGLGARLHIEMSKLIEIYRYRQDRTLSSSQELIDPSQTAIPEFDQSEEKLENLSLAGFCSGPEQSRNYFHETLIKEIENATTSIVFAHFFFVPTKPLKQALIAAAKRGVQIRILTNTTNIHTPILNYGFVERSRYGYKQLFSGQTKENITIYEYNVPKVTYHKKVIVIDDETVFIGSSNIIQKSLEQQDYEIDLAIKSPAFAARVSKHLEPDFQEKFKITDHQIQHITWKTATANIVLTTFAFLN